MRERVCIVGMDLIESTGPIKGFAHKEVLFQTTRKAMDEAGIERKDIGSAFTASYDFLEGRSLSNQFTLDAIGGVMKPCDIRFGEVCDPGSGRIRNHRGGLWPSPAPISAAVVAQQQWQVD